MDWSKCKYFTLINKNNQSVYQVWFQLILCQKLTNRVCCIIYIYYILVYISETTTTKQQKNDIWRTDQIWPKDQFSRFDCFILLDVSNMLMLCTVQSICGKNLGLCLSGLIFCTWPQTINNHKEAAALPDVEQLMTVCVVSLELFSKSHTKCDIESLKSLHNTAPLIILWILILGCSHANLFVLA